MSAPPTLPSDGQPAVRLRVLLAEDNLVNQEVATRMLARLGCQVDVVGDGIQAVAAVRDDRYDAVVMDIRMPELDGLGATMRIRAEIAPDNQPYIIALTASASVADRDACRAAGMDAFLAKPIRVSELAEALQDIEGRPKP